MRKRMVRRHNLFLQRLQHMLKRSCGLCKDSLLNSSYRKVACSQSKSSFHSASLHQMHGFMHLGLLAIMRSAEHIWEQPAGAIACVKKY